MPGLTCLHHRVGPAALYSMEEVGFGGVLAPVAACGELVTLSGPVTQHSGSQSPIGGNEFYDSEQPSEREDWVVSGAVVRGSVLWCNVWWVQTSV